MTTPKEPGLYLAIFSDREDLLLGWEGNCMLYSVDAEGRISSLYGLGPLRMPVAYIRIPTESLDSAVVDVNAQVRDLWSKRLEKAGASGQWAVRNDMPIHIKKETLA